METVTNQNTILQTRASASPTVQLSTLVRAQNGPGPVSLPLASGTYMRFKYVQGVPSAREGEGYPLYKLRMLDVLIDRLHKMKADSTTSTATPRSEEAIDVMIENYERQIDAAAASLGQVGYGTSWGLGLGDTGTLVSAVA